jgi:hypothetical protein
MPVTGPRKVTTRECPQPASRPATLPKKDFLHILRTVGVPEETIRATDEQLHDPIDLERDAVFLVTHGWDRDQLINRMGGSEVISAKWVRTAGELSAQTGTSGWTRRFSVNLAENAGSGKIR